MNSDDTLRTTLHRLLRSGTTSNPALDRLLDDYTRYHLVFVVLGGAFTIALLVSAVAMLRRSRARSESVRRRHLGLGCTSGALGVLFGLIVAGNISNVLDSRTGFAGSIGMIRVPRSGTRADQLQEAFDGWLRSGRARMPLLVQQAVDDRLTWQRPKAIVCALLLVGCGVLSARVWRRLLRGSGGRASVGVALLLGCVVLMAMVIGNTQGSLAPLSLTLFFG